MASLIDLFLHLDKHLVELVTNYGRWIYGILFAIVFAETGLVVTPFLPGDSLLFACGALAATGTLDVWARLGVTDGGGDSRRRGELLDRPLCRARGCSARKTTRAFWHRVLNREHLAEAHAFFERHGGRAIVLARFVPIVRTFVPFVAGAGTMTYSAFAFYNVAGAILWVSVCVGAGYAFGNVPVDQEQLLARGAGDRSRLGSADGDRFVAALAIQRVQ